MECEIIFREVVLIVSNFLRDLGVIWLFIDELMVFEDVFRIVENCIVQLVIFVIQYVIVQLLKFWKIYFLVVIGYSLGEFVVVCVVGIMIVKEVVKLVLVCLIF